MDLQIVSAFVLYFCILVGIGLLASRKHTSEADFMVGNRSLNFWVTALSAHASDMSAWLFMSFPAFIFAAGLPKIWIAIGLLLGMFLNWQFVATKLRIATENYQCYTLATFFERRFNDRTGTIRILAALAGVIFMTFYLSAGLIAMGFLLESLFGIDYHWGILFATLVVVIYTFTGGFVAVAWTDMFQAIFLLGVIILVPILAFTKTGGVAEIQHYAEVKGISFDLFEDYSWRSLFGALNLAVGWGIGYFGMPHIITKFMGIKSATEMHKSKYLGMSWQFLAMSAAAAVGIVAIAYFPDGLPKNELVFVEMVKSLFNPFVIGFLLCGVIAANMSTMDSQILVCASIISEDLYKYAFHKTATSAQILRASRLAVVGVSLFALAMASTKSQTVADTVVFAWTGLGASFGPAVIAALYGKQVNRFGIIAGILVGSVIAGTWWWINPYLTDFPVMAMIPACVLSFVSIFAVSALTRGCCEEVTG
jgi:sodium/proline symporter